MMTRGTTDDLFLIHSRIGDLIDLLDSSPTNPLAIGSARAVCGWCCMALADLADRYRKIEKHKRGKFFLGRNCRARKESPRRCFEEVSGKG